MHVCCRRSCWLDGRRLTSNPGGMHARGDERNAHQVNWPEPCLSAAHFRAPRPGRRGMVKRRFLIVLGRFETPGSSWGQKKKGSWCCESMMRVNNSHPRVSIPNRQAGSHSSSSNVPLTSPLQHARPWIARADGDYFVPGLTGPYLCGSLAETTAYSNHFPEPFGHAGHASDQHPTYRRFQPAVRRHPSPPCGPGLRWSFLNVSSTIGLRTFARACQLFSSSSIVRCFRARTHRRVMKGS